VKFINWLRCHFGTPAYRVIDPTGGDPFLGGPVSIIVCPNCGVEKWAHGR